MDTCVIKSQASDGAPLEATFSTAGGLRLVSYKRAGVEVIDPTGSSFGSPVGPHYADRNPGIIAPLPEGDWAQIEKRRGEGYKDPFAYGISRYAPWNIQSDPSSLKGTLTGKQEWQGTTLSALEGQQFTMGLQASLAPNGLEMNLSVVSEADSLVGFDYPIRLPSGKATLNADTRETYHESRILDLANPIDRIFHPLLNPLEGHLTIDTVEYRLKIVYRCTCEQNSWQIVRALGSSFVFIRPLSAKMPQRPSLTVSSLAIRLTIEGL